MENNVKQTREEPRDPEQAESLSEAELDSVIGGTAINTSRSNTKENCF
jgi:hypothetical protein